MTGEQLNALPPEIQANIHRMMNAAPLETRTKPDGSKSTIFAPPPYEHEKAQEFRRRHTDKTSTPTGTLLAEEILKREQVKKINRRLLAKEYRVEIDSLTTLKKVTYDYKDVQKPLTYVFTDAADFITNYDAYQPFLLNCDTIHLHFQKQRLTGSKLKEILNSFSINFIQNKPKKWTSDSELVLFIDRYFIFALYDIQMGMALNTAMVNAKNLIVSGSSAKGANLCKVFNITKENCAIWGFTTP
ncbi:MAG: hypothetical protein H2057_01205 [Alphaproteobacteria bacterium]|nr:hypothetical protein [Alphaproteobacteria bacterium]